jgi:hypothetical protein
MKPSLVMSKNNMVCKFCNTHCIKADRERKRYWWWDCKGCDVSFLVSLKGEIDEIKFESKEEYDRYYTINILINQKRTDICIWNKVSPDLSFGFNGSWKTQPNKSYYTRNLVTSFNQIMEITPTNFQNKLKTYLLLL